VFYLAKYGTQTTFGFPMVKRAVVDLAATADWTPATGDTKVSKDFGNVANTTNNPAAVGGTGSVGWTLVLTATELTAAEVQVQIVDSATKAVEDQFITIYTYGNASAKIKADLSDSVRLGLTALPNAAAQAAGGLSTIPTNGTGTAQAGASGSITLASGAPATDNFFSPCVVKIIAGTGAGQSRLGVGYVGSTKVLSVLPAWTTNPSTDSVYEICPGVADIEAWLKGAPGALVSGAVPASADLVTWLGTAPLALTSQMVQSSVKAVQNNAITAASIATDAIDADALASDALAEIVAAVRAMVIETNGSYTLQQALSVMLAVMAGRSSNNGDTYNDPTNTATRVAATVDGNNNRTVVVVSPSS
jgi:hypothetical protein